MALNKQYEKSSEQDATLGAKEENAGGAFSRSSQYLCELIYTITLFKSKRGDT